MWRRLSRLWWIFIGRRSRVEELPNDPFDLRYVEPRDLKQAAALLTRVEVALHPSTEMQESDERLVSPATRRALHPNHAGSVGWAGPFVPIADLTGVRWVSAAAPPQAVWETLSAHLRNAGAAYVAIDFSDERELQAWYWQPGLEQEVFKRLAPASRLDPGVGFPDLEVLAGKIWRPDQE